MALSVESRLLLSTASRAVGDDTIRALVDSPVDWGKLIAASLVEGAQPVLSRRLRGAAADGIPGPVEASMRQIERASTFRLAYLQRRLADAVAVLCGAGIPVLLLKGAALGHTVYGTFADRPMADVDLLVERDRVAEARALLLGSGWAQRYDTRFDEWYEEMHHLPPLVDARAPALEVGLDLHVELFSKEANPFRFPLAELWRDARQVPGLPEGALAPSPLHQLLHCCLHYAWSHQLCGAAWRTYRDVAAICSEGRIDWDAFVGLAERTRGAACCYWTLRLARSLVDAPVPDAVLKRLQPPSPTWLLRAMERHFTHEAVRMEQVCPSNRLRMAIWTAAMRSDGEPTARFPARPWNLLHGSKPDASPDGDARPALSVRAWIRFVQSVAA